MTSSVYLVITLVLRALNLNCIIIRNSNLVLSITDVTVLKCNAASKCSAEV
jgi:hypothetical protein